MSERQLKTALVAMGVWKTVLEPVFVVLVVFAVSYWLFQNRPVRVCVMDTAACASICGSLHGNMVGTHRSESCAAQEPIECTCEVP